LAYEKCVLEGNGRGSGAIIPVCVPNLNGPAGNEPHQQAKAKNRSHCARQGGCAGDGLYRGGSLMPLSPRSLSLSSALHYLAGGAKEDLLEGLRDQMAALGIARQKHQR